RHFLDVLYLPLHSARLRIHLSKRNEQTSSLRETQSFPHLEKRLRERCREHFYEAPPFVFQEVESHVTGVPSSRRNVSQRSFQLLLKRQNDLRRSGAPSGNCASRCIPFTFRLFWITIQVHRLQSIFLSIAIHDTHN